MTLHERAGIYRINGASSGQVGSLPISPDKQLTLNPSAATPPSCSKEHDPTKSLDYAQSKRTELHERAPNSKAN